ncbi:DNA-3-methyladenine glycosylase 2 family protein [Burkholderia stagnalis]|uniref:DNA-3-methyladenine glycosylase family protein n=1 Tax=Burkholderia stagnalis TaxID=1503054 RepID=UPI000F56D223|nr:DNA-3-methyladenine glycosylase [Burkholderia stagnalis]RQQ13563.1 DNA-3-methyladenine glycosylase 2 family protein [Burkholderia stagnalis]RQQ17949.1 DNA-3-methyladenine glycosylase 2 family protein [Burkholderia stagnalis]RQQ22490.1 DNA-3-methyladenine glycosylase 2 family protein [Burkholderia stagnalis]RQQ24650.1 DNA-3-methyladenine glycosylase 2 family protein [Burkholderia stagnalis]RQQ36788.1 DNA-3-methyladenine glycosylase 2 family protein [Burkholderia stagnalis]
MATARKAPVKRATPVATRPAAKRALAAKADAKRAAPNGALNGQAQPARVKGVDAVQVDGAVPAVDVAGRKARASDPVAPAEIDGVDVVVRPAYWDKACADLVKRDRILKKLIPKFGPAHLVKRGDPFVTLARSVVGQQISVASAQSVWARIEAACPKLAPQQVIKLGADKLIACGLSKRKTEYILDLAQHFVSGALHVDKWTSMDDEDVIAELTQIRGISRWTAEMFLIFNLSRPDVLPLDDPGLIRAISVNYFSGEPVTRSEAREVAANWEPWRTVATWYMWRSLDSQDAEG